MSRKPGPTRTDPFSPALPDRTPGPLGCRDAADPNCLAHWGDTPGSLGVNDHAAMLAKPELPSALEFLQRHREAKDHLIQAVRLDSCVVKVLNLNSVIWRINGAVIYRLNNIKEDLDGSPRAYHPPTDEFWTGCDQNNRDRLGRDILPNAVGDPSPKKKPWPLTSGCKLLEDFYKAKRLNELREASSKAELSKILDQHQVKTFEELEIKSKSAICVKYVPGRPKEDSRRDWKHVKKWVGVQTDGAGKPLIRQSGSNAGFYLPACTPSWADAEQHPWLVLNPRLKTGLGVSLGNYAVVVVNGKSPRAGFGIIADQGPHDGLGECSWAMIEDLSLDHKRLPGGDYIYVQFPGTGSLHKKSGNDIRNVTQEFFSRWEVEGRRGIEAIKELFPTKAEYDRMLLKGPGGFPLPSRSRMRV